MNELTDRGYECDDFLLFENARLSFCIIDGFLYATTITILTSAI